MEIFVLYSVLCKIVCNVVKSGSSEIYVRKNRVDAKLCDKLYVSFVTDTRCASCVDSYFSHKFLLTLRQP